MVVRKASIDDVNRGQTTPSSGPFRNSQAENMIKTTIRAISEVGGVQ